MSCVAECSGQLARGEGQPGLAASSRELTGVAAAHSSTVQSYERVIVLGASVWPPCKVQIV